MWWVGPRAFWGVRAGMLGSETMHRIGLLEGVSGKWDGSSGTLGRREYVLGT